jgi:hypothetical protein
MRRMALSRRWSGLAFAFAALAVAGCSGSVGTLAPTPSITVSGGSTAAATSTAHSPTAGATLPAAGTSATASQTVLGTAAATAPAATATPRPTLVGPTPTAKPSKTATPTSAATPRPTTPPSGPCYVLPSNNVWNKPVSSLPVASNSAAMIAAIGLESPLHPDFDAVGDGIPYNIVTGATTTYSVSFRWADESDNVRYPIPTSPRIEGGSDRHLISVNIDTCQLWELYNARKSGSSWAADSGAFFDLRSNALRPAGWTSADAAGLPIFPGLVRYSDIQTGSILHALRFTAPDTCGYIYPARHQTAAPCSNLPPMGLRVRLKASVDISGFAPEVQILLKALKKYGMILADNGSPWYVSGVPDNRWDDDAFHALHLLHGSDFEVVDTSGLKNG